MAPPSDLVAAIKNATADTTLQEALLFGAYGESGWSDSSAGYFGFTSSNFAGDAQKNAAGQVAAIIPYYQAAENELPSGVTGVSAAEYIALGGEAPVFSTVADLSAYPLSVSDGTEYQLGYSYTPGVPIPPSGISQQQVIAETGQPTQYGGNTSINDTSTWSEILSALSAPYVATGPGEQNAPPSKSGTSGQRETLASANAIAQTNLASLSPNHTKSANPNNPRGFVQSMNQWMNPQLQNTGTDQHGNTTTFWGGLEDVLTGQTELHILGDITGTNTIIHDAEVVANPTNILLSVREWLVRLAVFAIGAVVVFIAVNALTNGALMNLFSKAPVPVPV